MHTKNNHFTFLNLKKIIYCFDILLQQYEFKRHLFNYSFESIK